MAGVDRRRHRAPILVRQGVDRFQHLLLLLLLIGGVAIIPIGTRLLLLGAIGEPSAGAQLGEPPRPLGDGPWRRIGRGRRPLVLSGMVAALAFVGRHGCRVGRILENE